VYSSSHVQFNYYRQYSLGCHAGSCTCFFVRAGFPRRSWLINYRSNTSKSTSIMHRSAAILMKGTNNAQSGLHRCVALATECLLPLEYEQLCHSARAISIGCELSCTASSARNGSHCLMTGQTTNKPAEASKLLHPRDGPIRSFRFCLFFTHVSLSAYTKPRKR
jgi:hypothetical protein